MGCGAHVTDELTKLGPTDLRPFMGNPNDGLISWIWAIKTQLNDAQQTVKLLQLSGPGWFQFRLQIMTRL